MKDIFTNATGTPVACRLSASSGRHCKYRLLIISVLFFGLVLAVSPVSAAVHTLNPGDNIQAGIIAAFAGDTLILNPGTYSEHDITITKNNLIIKANESLGGTFANTIIDGLYTGGIFNAGGNTLTIDNLTLIHGAADNGGGIYSLGGIITATSCNFTSCTANYGGGIFSNGGDADLTSCVFTGCTAGVRGGGICSSGGGIIDLTSCNLTGCTAGFGGGIWSTGGSIDLTSCNLTGCTADVGGGIWSTGGSIDLTSCTFDTCTAVTGGGICSTDSIITATSCTFSSCSTIAEGYGGGIYSTGGSVTATSCNFTDCTTADTSGGGALYSGLDNSAIHYCRFCNCNPNAIYNDGGTVNAENNWWCTNDNPSGYTISVDCDPWLVLGITAQPSSITTAGTSLIKANLTSNSDGADTSAGGHVPDGIPVAFSIISGTGTLSSLAGNIASGLSTTIYTPAATGSATIDATIDGVTVDVPVVITVPPPVPGFTGTPLTGTSPLTVTFTDSSTGSPTAWNWSFGDGEWFNTTVSSNPVHIYDTAGTYTVDLTVSNAGGSDTLSRANYIVVSAATPTPTYPPGGGGGGGSSGGGSNTDTGIGYVEDLKAGESASFNMGKGAVYRVVIVAGTNIHKLMITVLSEGSLPSSIVLPDGTVYEFEDVTIYYADNGDLSGGTFYFKVPKSWFKSNGFDLGDIVLLHYNEETGEWEDLETTFTGGDGTYYYYTAETPSFSYFAIAYSKGSTIVSEETATATPAAVMAESTPVNTAAPAALETQAAAASPDNGSSLSSLIISGLVILLIAIIAVGLITRRKSGKYPEWWDHGKR